MYSPVWPFPLSYKKWWGGAFISSSSSSSPTKWGAALKDASHLPISRYNAPFSGRQPSRGWMSYQLLRGQCGFSRTELWICHVPLSAKYFIPFPKVLIRHPQNKDVIVVRERYPSWSEVSCGSLCELFFPRTWTNVSLSQTWSQQSIGTFHEKSSLVITMIFS